MPLLVSNLRKSYGPTPALQGIDLALEGGVVALLGPNGSGKTTLLRCLASSLRPDDGEIVWAGRALWPNPRFLRQRMGYLPQELSVPGAMTPAQLLAHLAQLKGCHDTEQPAALLTSLGVGAVAERPFAALSAGQVRLVGVAQALLGDPALLLLDEPTRGFDVAEREAVFRQLRRLAPRALILFSTHVPDDVAQVARQVVVLREGCVLYAGAVEALRRQAMGCAHEVRLPYGSEAAFPPGCRITRQVAWEEETVVRVVGPRPPELPGVTVTATLEEAYLLLLERATSNV
jgi:ABC-type multidrug transport system ATPase subunit